MHIEGRYDLRCPCHKYFQSFIERERNERAALEAKLRDKTREILEQQAKYEAHIAESNARLVGQQFCLFLVSA